MNFNNFSLEGKPAWKIILRGAAIPGIIVAAFAFIGFLSSFGIDASPIRGIKFGAGLGLLLSLFGALEIITLIFLSGPKMKTAALLGLGYALIWVICVYLIF